MQSNFFLADFSLSQFDLLKLVECASADQDIASPMTANEAAWLVNHGLDLCCEAGKATI